MDHVHVQQVVGRPPARELDVLEAHGFSAQLTVKSPPFDRLPDDLDQYEADLTALLREQPTGFSRSSTTVDKF